MDESDGDQRRREKFPCVQGICVRCRLHYRAAGDAAGESGHNGRHRGLEQDLPVSDLAYRVELTPPDIEPYREGNTGIDYVTTFTSAAPDTSPA